MHRLIDSPSFIKKHNIHRSVIRERARSNDDEEEYAVVLSYQRKRKPIGYYSLNFDNNLNRAKAIELNCNFVKEERMNIREYDWCNGVFCFRKRQECYVFWNPSNGTFRKVDCSSCLPFSNTYMGYDSVNDDYKIIGFINNEAAALQIYSLRNNSWRKLVFHQRDFPRGRTCDVPLSVTRGVCLSGVIHWMWATNADENCIVAFNLDTETFTSSFSLPLPSESEAGLVGLSHFTDFRGRLCLTFTPPGYPSNTDGPHTMWVMENYGVGTSWSKLYSYYIVFATFPNFYFPNNTGRLLCFNDRSQWCWWDPQQGTFERIEILGVARAAETTAHVYVRNLVRLDQSLV